MTRKYPPAVAREQSVASNVPVTPRRFARAAVDIPAKYCIEGKPGWHASVIDELGGGGVRLQTRDDLEAGTVVALNFDVAGMPVSATSRIVLSLYDKSRERFVHGVAFLAIDPEHQKAIVAQVVALGGGDAS